MNVSACCKILLFDAELYVAHCNIKNVSSTAGFCVPLGNFTNCFVIDGRMSMHALGDTTDAVARFYNMTKTAMDTDVTEDDSLFDGSVYYYRAVEEKNVYSSSDNDDSVSQQAIIMLLVLLSVGLFSLTAAVLYLLCNRAGRESRGVVAATDGRLGISAINYLGSNWLEVKSTTSSSGSSDLSETTSKVSGKVKLPQIVGNSGSSVCGSSVSDLSAQTMETSRRNFNSNTDLEKIDEEAQSTGSLDRKTANLSPFTSPGDIEDAGKDSSTKINIENSDQGKIVGQDLDEQITREADASFYTSVETPPSSSVKYKNNLESSVRRTV